MTDVGGRYRPPVHDEQAALMRHDSDASLPAPPAPPLAPDGLAFRTALRALRPIIGQLAVQAASAAPSLERLQQRQDPPAVSACDMVEFGGPRAITQVADPVVCGFLDGIQRSRVLGHVHGSPIVFGTVAAVIRQRVARRLETWGTARVHHALYASRALIGGAVWAQLESSSMSLYDVSERADVNDALTHPLAARARSLELVAHRREAMERALAAEWCKEEQRWLWVDGGISGNLAIHETATAFGVVKSHQTLYGDASMIRLVLGLREGERSPTFLVTHRARRAVASWYLRLRDAGSGDPLHGLVRVEVAPSAALVEHTADSAVRASIAATSDRLSSWILAERRPLSLPDPRWDTLTYGVHGCETYLKALVGS